MTNQQKQAIRDMRRLGSSYSAIADALGLSCNTVKSFCHRENITAVCVDDSSNNCKNCGAPLSRHTGTKPRTFCSDKCRYAWWNRQRKYLGRKYRLTCYGCDTEFESSNKHRKYCGRECYIHSRYGEGLP